MLYPFAALAFLWGSRHATRRLERRLDAMEARLDGAATETRA